MSAPPEAASSPPPSSNPPPTYGSLPPIAPSPVRFPAWLDFSLILIGVGTLFTFIGFLFGYGAITALPTSSSAGSVPTYEGDLEAFFVLVGFGILFIVGGWIARQILPKLGSRRFGGRLR